MQRQIYLHLLLPFLLGIGKTSGLEVEIPHLDFLKVTPHTQNELSSLKGLRDSNSGLIFFNGIGEVNDISYVLGTPADIQKGQKYLGESETKVANLGNLISNSKLKLELPSEAQPESPYQNLNEPAPIPHKSSNNFAPIEKIPGTNLLAGIFYKISMKRFPRGWVTWTNDNTTKREGNYVQIDLNPKNLPYYQPNEKWYPDIHWGFGPSEKEGFYTLRNQHDTTALTTVLKERPDGYEHIIIARSPELKAQLSILNSPERSSALWKPEPSTTNNFYSFKNLKYPEGVISWTETKYGDYSHYLQVSLNKGHKVQYQNEWKDDILFRFDNPDVEIEGAINNFQFDATSVIFKAKDATYRKRQILNTFSWTNNGIAPMTINFREDHVVWNNSVSFTFDQNLTAFSSVKARISFPTLSTVSFTADLNLDINQGNSAIYTIAQNASIQASVEFLPKMKQEVTMYLDQLENIEIPFTGVMAVRTTSDRMLQDYSTSQKGPVPLSVASDILKGAGFTIDDQFGNLNTPEFTEFVKVSGVMKATIVIDVGFDAHP